MKKSKIRALAMFAVLAAIVLMGCATRGELIKSKTGQAETRTVGMVKAPDGVAIRYETAGRGEPALVFVHGWSCDRSYWINQIDYFSKSRLVVAIDLGGHGESGLGRTDWTVDSFGRDVQAVVEALGLQKVVLVGHSMAGSIIVEAARLMPDRVVALIPVDGFTSFMPMEQRDKFVALFRADFRKTTEDFVKHLFTPYSDPELVERTVHNLAAAPPSVAVSSMENYLLHYDQAAALAEVQLPVRLINADLWPTDLSFWRQYKADVELAVIPRVGHFIMIEDPEEFNRLLRRAVQELANPMK